MLDTGRCHFRRDQCSCFRIDHGKIHEPQIAAKSLKTADAFIVIQKVTAPVQIELVAVHFDSLQLMRRKAMENINTRIITQFNLLGIGQDLVRVNLLFDDPQPVAHHHDLVKNSLIFA